VVVQMHQCTTSKSAPAGGIAKSQINGSLISIKEKTNCKAYPRVVVIRLEYFQKYMTNLLRLVTLIWIPG